MTRLVVGEHTRIDRGGAADSGLRSARLDERLYDRLRRLDYQAGARGRVFDWHDRYARTTHWVGVVQMPGLQVEILPKIDDASERVAGPQPSAPAARANLLYMLAVSGDVPVRIQDIARLATRRAPLSETLAAIFADKLRAELLRGPERGYRHRVENLRAFRGKLLIARHTLANAAHRERFVCQFDELTEDTPLNRIFKASSRALLDMTDMPATQNALRQCLLLLDGVTETPLHDADFDAVSINRQNRRFEDLLRFCRLLRARRTPAAETGRTPTFSLLFDMNRLFERFVAALLREQVAPRIDGLRVYPQAARHQRHLMESDDRGVLRLAPDLLLERAGERVVMDTKWKRLSTGTRASGGVADGDLYQLYAYGRRYGCRRSILLYPHVPGASPHDLHVLDSTHGRSGERVAIRQLRLHRNLMLDQERAQLIAELETIVLDGFTPV